METPWERADRVHLTSLCHCDRLIVSRSFLNSSRVQTANLAVHGYGNDQAYLRLETELPHFRRPVAVVSLLMTALFGRNLDQDRPHLGPGLIWLPGEQRSRLSSLAKLLVPYGADPTVERGLGKGIVLRNLSQQTNWGCAWMFKTEF